MAVWLSVCRSICRSVCATVGLSVCRLVGRSVRLSVCVSVCLSVCLAVWPGKDQIKYTCTTTLIKTSFSQQSIHLFTNQVNTPGLGFFLDYICLCCASFQSLSWRRSSRGSHFFRWSSRSVVACWRARYVCIEGNLLVFSAGNKLESSTTNYAINWLS